MEVLPLAPTPYCSLKLPKKVAAGSPGLPPKEDLLRQGRGKGCAPFSTQEGAGHLKQTRTKRLRLNGLGPAQEVPATGRVVQAMESVKEIDKSQLSSWHKEMYENGYIILQGAGVPSLVEDLEDFVKSSHSTATDATQENLHWQEHCSWHPPQLVNKIWKDAIGESIEGSSWRVASTKQPRGFRCTDGVDSPDPFWDASWQEGFSSANGKGPPGSPPVLVSATSALSSLFHGNLVVFPRSHWLVHDCACSRAVGELQDKFILPEELPCAAPVQIRLRAGDAALLHPWLCWGRAPNTGAKTTQLIFAQPQMEMFDSSPNINPSGELPRAMWHQFPALAKLVAERPPGMLDKDSLLEEERKAELGQWASSSLPQDFLLQPPVFPWPLSCVDLKDLLAWQLRVEAQGFLLDDRWHDALPFLRRLVGLRPSSFWAFYQAGLCTLLTAPSGQLAGRAGRKCHLEDAERFLVRALDLAPGWPPTYAALAKCLLAMGRGREKEVAPLVASLLQRPGLSATCHQHRDAAAALVKCLEMVKEALLS